MSRAGRLEKWSRSEHSLLFNIQFFFEKYLFCDFSDYFKVLSFNSRVTTTFPLASTYSALWKLAWILSGLCKVSTILSHIRDDGWDGVDRFLFICVCFAQISHIRALTNVLWLNWADGFVIKMSLSQNKFLWLFLTLHLCVGIYICFSV